jgi:putative ABC transport system permease protein
VESAGVISNLPLSGAIRFVYFCPEGSVCQGLGKDPVIALRQVTPGAFSALRVPLLRGRLLQPADSSSAARVVLINDTVARRHFAGADPIGKHLANSRDRIPLEIVGVVGDVKFTTLGAASFAEMYLPQSQSPALASTLVVRSSGDPQPLVAAVRAAVARQDPNLATGAVQSMNAVVSASLAQPRLTAQLVGSFALLALALASVGIYGVMAYTVTQRTQEMQIRLALGARPRDIFGLVLGQGARLVGLGIGLGLLASFAVNRLLASLLFATSASDPATYAAVALLLLAVAAAACCIPARRATRIDAVLALR